MKSARGAERILPRGRVAKWSKEQIDKLSTLELRALLANAERLKESEVAALCNELLDARPHGRPLARRPKQAGEPRQLVARNKAFELNGVSVRSRIWSRGGTRGDGTVFLAMFAQDVQRAGATSSCLLWGPNVAGSRPWSDSPGGQERLQHCRIALERGASQGVLTYGRPKGADRADAQTVLDLQVEQRGDEYWATWTSTARVVVNTFE